MSSANKQDTWVQHVQSWKQIAQYSWAECESYGHHGDYTGGWALLEAEIKEQ